LDLKGSSYTLNGVVIHRLENENAIISRNGGWEDAHIDQKGFSCHETGEPSCGVLRPGESITIPKSNYFGTYISANTNKLTMNPEPKPEPKKPEVQVEVDDGRHIDLGDE
jgi:hypothetical protein